MAFILVTLSCQIGLGASVDTEAPTLSISYPPSSAVIRGTFTFYGTWNDDQGVTAGSVTVKNTETSATYGPYEVTVNSDKTWSVSLNTNDASKIDTTSDTTKFASSYKQWEYPDGKYEVSITVSDAAGHISGTSSRSFEIDNTVPLFILSSPGAKDIDNATPYGASFKVTGTIADDHAIEAMAVSVYDASKALKNSTPYVFNNVNTAGGTSVKVAVFNSSDSNLKSHYAELYGSTKEGTKKYSCTVSLTDAAHEYTNPSETTNTTAGNTTSSFYLYDDVYSYLLSTATITSTKTYGLSSGLGLEADDIKKLVNGTKTGDNAAIVAAVLSGATSSSASFSLNPDASPKYNVTGLGFSEVTDIAQKGIGGNTGGSKYNISIVATAGRDGTLVKPETLHAYLFGPYSTLSDVPTGTTLENLYDDPVQYAAANPSLTVDLGQNVYTGSTVETYSFARTLPDTINANQYYLIAVTGTDADNIEITPSDNGDSASYYYGFKGETSNNPPSISWGDTDKTNGVNIADLSVYGSSALSFSGSTTSGDGKVSKLDWTVTVTDEANNNTKIGTVTGTDDFTDEATVNWEFSLADGTEELTTTAVQQGLSAGACKTVPAGKQYLFDVIVYSTSDSSVSSPHLERRIHVDTTAPVVKITSMTPIVFKTDGSTTTSYVNGKITVSGKITETNLADVQYAVYCDNNGTAADSESLGSVYSFDKVIDTRASEFTNEKDIKIVITATDEAGNTGTYSSTDYNSTVNNVSTSFVLDQSTDKPVVSFTNASDAIHAVSDSDSDKTNDIKAAYGAGSDITNLFGVTSNNKLNATITDDDGVKSVVVNKRVAGTSTYDSTPLFSKTGMSSTTYPLSVTLPATEGAYDLQLVITDTDGTSTEYNQTTDELTVAVDAGAPTFTAALSNGSYYKGGASVAVALTANDASGTVTVSNGTAPVTMSGNASTGLTGTNTVTANADEGTYTVTYTATDAYGQNSKAAVSYTVDNTAPAAVISSTNPFTVGSNSFSNSDTSGKWFNTTSLVFTGYYSESSSGISGCSYFINPTTTTPTSANVASLAPSGTFSTMATTGSACKFSVSIAGFSTSNGGLNNLYIAVKDNAGNVAVSGAYVIKIDQDAPTLTCGTSTTQLTNCSTALSIAGAYADTASGVNKITLKINGKSINAPVSAPSANGNWSADGATLKTVLSGLATSTYPVTADIIDAAGNTATYSLFSIQVDKTAPSAAISASIPTSNLNGKKQVSGTVNEDNAPASFALYYSTTDEDATDSTGTLPTSWKKFGSTIATASSIYNWSFSNTFDFGTLSGAATASDGKATIYLLPVVYDKAGNCNIHAASGYTADFSQCSNYATTYSVDQNTDRPVIKLSNISISGSTIRSSNTLFGTITDDDGISEFWYADNATTAAKKVTSENGWKSITPTDGSWSVNAGDDGAKTFYFAVTDTEGGTFATLNTSALKRPYISDGTTAKADNNTAVTFNVDTTPPKISSLAVYRSSSDTAPDAAASDWTTTAGTVFGGTTYTKLYAKIVATEAVGMHSSASSDLAITIGGSSVTPAITRSADSTTYTYIAGPVAVSSLSSGVLSLAVTVTDNAELSSNNSLNIMVDTDAPVLSITSPGTTTADCITSSVTIKGTSSDSGSGVASIQYCIPTVAEQTTNALIGTTSHTAWTTLETTSTISVPLDWAAVSRYSTTTYAAAVTGTNLVKIPVYFKTTDKAGNSKVYTGNYFYADTDASLAKAAITYPTDTAAVGSSLTVYGTASDDVSVNEVWVQLDVNGDGSCTAADYDIIKGWGDSSILLVPSDATVSGSVLSKTDDAGSWHIKATGTNSWKLSVDSSKLNYTVASGTLRQLGVSVRAWDGTKTYDASGAETTTLHIRNWPTYVANATENAIRVTVDAGVPTISNLSLVQYSGTTAVKTLPYESGIYISGADNAKTWYLEGTVTDDKALDSYAFNDVASDSGMKVTASTKNISGSSDTKTTSIKQELSTTTTGQIYTQLVVTDTTGKSNPQYIIINVDNTAPAIYNTSDTAVSGTTDALRIENASNQKLGGTYVVENSDGSFTFGDKVTESGSGLAYLAFDFGRIPKGETAENRVYCPQYGTSETVGGTSYTSLSNKSIFSGTSGTAGSVYRNDDGLACMYVTGTTTVNTANGTTTLTATNIKGNHNVRVGGLVKYNGVYRRISSVDWNAGSVTFSPATTAVTTANGATAELVYAQVVDHNGIEISDAYGETDNGDGDGMNEVLKIKGSAYTWQASILSDNIPDGPIVIHVVAIDAAGNISSGTIKTSIANNRPRIAKVLLGTDLNGSGYFDYYNADGTITNNGSDKDTANNTQFGEFVYYSTLNKSTGKEQSLVTISTTKPFVVKNGLCVLPEFVGGNGVLKYGYGIEDAAATSPISGTNALAAEQGTAAGTLLVKDKTGTAQSITTQIQTTQVNAAYQYGGVVLTDNSTTTGLGKYESWIGSTKNLKYLSFTFWDATEETTQGTDSLWAMVNIPAYINVTDDVAPVAAITPFYWNSKDDSSVPLDSNGSVLGHIDLEADLGAANPGVSGEVYIRGTAYDDTRLGSLFMTTPATGETHQVALYKNGTWLTGSDTDSDNSQLYSTTWSWPTNWKKFEITSEDEPSQDGHTVTWKFTVDMTKYGVVTAKTVQVQAKDAAASANESELTTTAAKTQTTKASPTPTYIMDFVPYIKDVAGSYRSRLGRYPVQAGSTITIDGFNFASDATYAVNFYKTVSGKQGSTATAYSGTITHATDGQISIVAPQYSCYVEVTVAEVKTQNNTNTNKGYNIQSGYVASDTTTYGATAAAAAGTNFWTDDCYLSVWKVGTTFTDSANPIHGTIEKLMSTSVKYVNGEAHGSGKNISLADNTFFGVWGGEDNMFWDEIFGGAKAYTINGQSSGFLGTPPAEIDTCVVNGNVFYALLDDTWKDAATFGQGLELLRDGTKIQACDNSLYKYHVEFTKNDGVRDQFQNPKVAGWYGTSTNASKSEKSYHLYLSYYDRDKKCLKYAKIEYRDTIDVQNSEDLIAKYTTDQQIVGGTLTTPVLGAFVVDGYDSESNTSLSWDIGQYSDIKVDASSGTPVPVIVYYDKGNGVLKIAKGTTTAPVATRVQSDNGTTSVGDSEAWTYTAVSNPSGVSDFGRFVSMEMDSNYGLHIVAQDVDNSILYYGYFTPNGSSYTQSGSWIKVDATSSVGRWTDVKLEDSTKTGMLCKPIVTYMDASCLNTTRAVKIAYVDSATSATAGSWEAITDPSKYESKDVKLSIVNSIKDGSGLLDRYAIGINSNVFAIDFLRDEQ
jgi:hypothetical protein